MRISRIVLIAGIVFVCCTSVWRTSGDEPAKPKMWNFDKDKVGEIAPGFTSEVGEWKVVADETAPGKGQVLAQLAKNEDAALNLALVKDSSVKQVDVSVKFKAVGGKIDQGGGVVWRAKDAKNYYLCRYNPLEENLRVYKVVDGKRTVIESIDIEHTEGWHTLRAQMRSERITVFYDDDAKKSVNNDTFMDAGMVGLWTKADAQTYFDDFAYLPL
jgi:hypothetical protein